MIKMVRAWVDSEGGFHTTREAACKAEFRRLLLKHFYPEAAEQIEQFGEDEGGELEPLQLDALVENMFDIDRIFGEATKEDNRVEFAPRTPAEDEAG